MKWMVFWASIAALFGILLFRTWKSHNNVCKTFEDYYTDRDNNPNCYYNPEHDLLAPEIIRGRGYSVETHYVTTKDGYILTIFRIPHGKTSLHKKPGPPIFIQHGYTMNSASFVNTGNKSLSFILADAGYDVWLSNSRGTLYSRNHSYLSDSDKEFWNYGFHEKAVYDLPAQLDLVNSVTKQKIIYIGYSMGCALSYIYGITYPDIAHDKVKIFISFAPMASLSEWNSVAKYAFWIPNYLGPLLQSLTNGEIYPRGVSYSRIVKLLCSPFPFQMKMCQLIDMLSMGLDYEQNDPETLPASILQNRDAVSVKSLIHYSQVVVNGGFKYFDYGAEINEEMYGLSEPPPYNLSKLTVPVYILRGEGDLLITKKDIDKLYEALPNEVKPYDIYDIKYNNFNHLDFVMARDVVSLVYDHLLNFIKKL